MRSVCISVLCAFASLFTASAQITLNPFGTRALGQTTIQIRSINPNLVEGRELLNPQGIALDPLSGGLYIADTSNNRVLGYRNAAALSNGQTADIVIGQPDLFTTLPARNSGLTGPTGLAVDASGNLYVVDAFNNRVLRFPKPFSQTGAQTADLVIGQKNLTGTKANTGGISESTLSFLTDTGSGGVTLDSAGNVWVADTGNNRVLRFPVASLKANGPAADVVLGQPDFVSTGGPASSTSLNGLNTPSSLIFDTGGRLFVAESPKTARGRILIWTAPFTTGKLAARILGVNQDTPAPPIVSDTQLGVAPGALFTVGNAVGIADSSNHRLLIFQPFDQFNFNPFYQPAITVVGQANFTSGDPNRGQVSPDGVTLGRPGAAVFSGTQLFVADSGNHRVVVLPVSGNGFGAATRVLGQDRLDLNSPNLLEGRELNFSGGDAGLVVDVYSAVPHLYIADTSNNRILGYRDVRTAQSGAKADLVIGQADFLHSMVNYPSNDVLKPTASSLFLPIGVAVDSSGNLFVADTGNGRVLRFPTPFDHYTPGVAMPADLVIGQLSFTSKITDATSRTMAAPYGLAFIGENGLAVSDGIQNRVLLFPGKSKDFSNGMAALIVFGQSDFNSSGAGSGLNQLNAPRHIASDTDDRLYITDPGNHRVLIYDRAPAAASGTSASIVLTSGLSTPKGVHVNSQSGDIWVADPAVNAVLRYPKFNSLVSLGLASNGLLSELAPLAVTEDAWGNVYVADSSQRVIIHYPGLVALNAANFLGIDNPVVPVPLAPGLIATVFSQGNTHQFGEATAAASSVPLPKTLNGIQVLVDGKVAPLFYQGTDQINFQVPWSAPDSGIAEILVTDTVTGRILGSIRAVFYTASPGIFTQAGNGSGAAVAVNQDGTLNSQNNAEFQGNVMTIYATGQGAVEAPPADGDIANRIDWSKATPLVIFTPGLLGDVLYSGLAPTLVGVWQLNVRIPLQAITQPTIPVQVIISQNNQFSGGGGAGRSVIVYIKKRP